MTNYIGSISTRTFLLGAVLLSVTACSNSGNGGGISSLNSQSLPALTELSVSDANSEACPAGGKVYSLYIDINGNGIQDLSEPTISSQTVCNGINGATGATGATGANGYNALIATNRVTTDLDACLSGSGLQISYGLDSNNNGILDTNEIANTQVLCDGANGATGASGPAGSNGHSIVFAAVPADPIVCPAGGTTTLMALDINDTGFYSALDSNQEAMTICNGQNGANGQDATVGAYTPVNAIMPCGDTVAYKEVLLVLENGDVLASFSENAAGLETRFSLLPDGSYVDTDSSNCNFSLSTSGNTRSISWFGSIQESWAVQ